MTKLDPTKPVSVYVGTTSAHYMNGMYTTSLKYEERALELIGEYSGITYVAVLTNEYSYGDIAYKLYDLVDANTGYVLARIPKKNLKGTAKQLGAWGLKYDTNKRYIGTAWNFEINSKLEYSNV